MGHVKSMAVALCLGMTAIGPGLLTPRNADAALMAVDLSELAGVDTFLTRDTVSGLDWLDVNLTVNISYSSIVGGAPILNGGALHGLNPLSGAPFTSNPFRHATKAELLSLLSHAAVPDLDMGFTDPNYAPLENLFDLIGNTSFSTSFAGTDGYLADIVPPGQQAVFILSTCASSHPGCTGAGIAAGPEFSGLVNTTHQSGAGAMHPNVGHFLVRASPSAAIPEPASWALFLGGLTALAGLRRRRGNG